jgi:hypothetical protein
LHGTFVWARRALNRPFRRFPARAVEELLDRFHTELQEPLQVAFRTFDRDGDGVIGIEDLQRVVTNLRLFSGKIATEDDCNHLLCNGSENCEGDDSKGFNYEDFVKEVLSADQGSSGEFLMLAAQVLRVNTIQRDMSRTDGFLKPINDALQAYNQSIGGVKIHSVEDIFTVLGKNEGRLASVDVAPRTVPQVRKTPSWPRSWANFSLL